MTLYNFLNDAYIAKSEYNIIELTHVRSNYTTSHLRFKIDLIENLYKIFLFDDMGAVSNKFDLNQEITIYPSHINLKDTDGYEFDIEFKIDKQIYLNSLMQFNKEKPLTRID
jgi:hypothetical protein